MLVLLAVGLVQTWLMDGLVIPCRVVGGSMAESVLGVHRDVVCDDCGYSFACGADVLPAARAVCPNCGFAANDLESLPDVEGDRVLIDRTALAIRAPRRWETVAFRRSRQADGIFVKRVVGLPGESIEIRHGNVYVDGHIQRKNLAQQRALAVLVHDADYQPTRDPTPPPRWQAERPDSRWTAADGRFVHAASSDGGPVDWLVYHHARRSACSGRACPPCGARDAVIEESPITDLCGYNPSQPRREEDVHVVTDLMLSFRLEQIRGRGAFLICIADGSNHFEARLQFDDDRLVECAAACKQTVAHCEIPAVRGERFVEVSLVDQQFLLAVDGQVAVAWAYDRPESSPTASSCPLAIGTEGIEVAVRGLRVYRDVYYTHPIGVHGHPFNSQPVRLADGEYYVLGDNSSISEDSRTWPERGTVDAKLLVGKPLVAIPSVPLLFEGRWHFQVPNPLRIRYIQ